MGKQFSLINFALCVFILKALRSSQTDRPLFSSSLEVLEASFPGTQHYHVSVMQLQKTEIGATLARKLCLP